MIVVLRVQGLSFVIFVDDHEPAHVHVRGDGRLKINIGEGGIKLLAEAGMKQSDIRRALRLVAENRTMLLARWRDIHG